jgi:hypothetical protein
MQPWQFAQDFGFSTEYTAKSTATAMTAVHIS